MQKDILAQQELNDRLGLSKEAIASLDAAKLESQAVTLDLIAIKTLDKTLDEAQYNLYKAQAEELRNLARLKRYGAAKEASIDAAKTAADEWKKTSDSINSTLTDALMRGFESGKGFAVNMRDTIVNMFKTMVFQTQVKMVVSAITGALGLTGAASAASGSAFAGVAGAASSGSTLASAGSWLSSSGFADGISDMTISVGNAFMRSGNEVLMKLGTSMGANATQIGEIAGSLGAAMGWINAAYNLSQGKLGAAIGGAVGMYFGPIGSFIGSTIGGWIDSKFGGEMRSGGQYFSNGIDSTKYVAGPSGGQISANIVVSQINSTQDAITTMLKAVGSKATLVGYQAGLETSDGGRGGVGAGGKLSTGATFGQSLKGSVYDGTMFDPTKGFNQGADIGKAFTLELEQSIIESLQATTDIPKTIRDIISTAVSGAGATAVSGLSETVTTDLLNVINTVVATVNSFRIAIELLPFENLKNLSFDAAAGLVAAAGGMDKLGANLNTYYTAFYSSEEQRKQSIKNINATLAGSGFDAATATRAQFRALVESQNVATDSGAKMYAALISVAGAFDALTPSIAATAAATIAVDTVLNNLTSTNASLQDQYNQLTLSASDYRLTQIAGYTDAQVAMFDANSALTTLIANLNKATVEAEALAAATIAIAASNSNLQDQLDILTGKRTQIEVDRANTLANLTSQLGITTNQTTIDLQNQVYAQQDLQSASASATKTISDALAAINSNLTAAQTATNTALSNVASAIAAQRTIKEAAVSAAQAQVDAITSVFDALQSNIKDLAPTSAAAGNAWLDAAIRSGGTSDQKGLADAMAAARGGLSNNNFSSAVDAARANQLLVNKLSVLSGMAGGQISNAQAQLVAEQDAVTALDALLKSAQDQVNGLRGTGTLSVTDAIAAMQLSVVAELQAIKAHQITSAMADGYDVATIIKDAWTNWGISEADVRAAGRAAGIPGFARGTNWVPQDMNARVHQGEAIIPAAFNPARYSKDSGNDALVTEIKALREEVKILRQTSERGNENTQRAADTLSGRQGVPFLVEIAK